MNAVKLHRAGSTLNGCIKYCSAGQASISRALELCLMPICDYVPAHAIAGATDSNTWCDSGGDGDTFSIQKHFFFAFALVKQQRCSNSGETKEQSQKTRRKCVIEAVWKFLIFSRGFANTNTQTFCRFVCSRPSSLHYHFLCTFFVVFLLASFRSFIFNKSTCECTEYCSRLGENVLCEKLTVRSCWSSMRSVECGASQRNACWMIHCRRMAAGEPVMSVANYE